MDEIEFIQIQELRVKDERDFLLVGKKIKNHIEKNLREKNIIYQKEYRILFITSSEDDIVQSCVFWITEHVRISGIRIRIFHRKEHVFEPPYTHYNSEGILMTFSETVATIVSRNIYSYDAFFFLTTHSIPEKHTDNIWLDLQEKIRQNIAYHKFLLALDIKQKIPSQK